MEKTNMKKNNSKEELLVQALRFHSQGNIIEAEKYYQIFLNQGFYDARVYANLGEIMRTKKNLKEAELFTLKAIKLAPNLPDAHSNLGLILMRKGNLKDAELSFRKAIENKPDLIEANLNTMV